MFFNNEVEWEFPSSQYTSHEGHFVANQSENLCDSLELGLEHDLEFSDRSFYKDCYDEHCSSSDESVNDEN